MKIGKRSSIVMTAVSILVLMMFSSGIVASDGNPQYYPVPASKQLSIKELAHPPYVWNGNWEPFGLEGKTVESIVTTQRYIYAGTYNDGLFRKELNNQSSIWQYIGFGGEQKINCVHVIDLAPLPDIIYVGLDVCGILDEYGEPHSLYKSMDGGITWYPCDDGLVTVDDYNGDVYRAPIFSINAIPDIDSENTVLYAGSIAHIFKSTNDGQSWSLIWGGGMAGMGIHVITIDPSDPQTVWAGGETGIFVPIILKSTDGGNTWNIVTPPYLGDNSCYSIVIHPQNSDIVYAGMEGRLAKTTDGGETWDFILSPPEYPYFKGLLLDPLNPSHIFAGGGANVPNEPLRVWGTGGHGWSCSVEEDASDVLTLAFDPNDHNIFYAGTLSDGVWICHSTWSPPYAYLK
ncbi:MAG: hypothetical protein DRN05_01650 [Thermoplasmata archaeon]|nr:MAG: hypothetical protein DRN05_01650 [Thermoplasmata archaeon]